MAKLFQILIIIHFICRSTQASDVITDVGNHNHAVYATSFIDDLRPDDARKACQVNSIVFETSSNLTKSYSCLITVNKERGSNLFFWFFPFASLVDNNAPIIVWMEGSPGPGVSSLFTLFNGNGPFVIHSNGSLLHREFSWTTFSNVIYLDIPVGTGFSHYRNDNKTRSSMTIKEVVEDLKSFFDQFFWMFPELQSNELYLAGSTFAAKYAVYFAQETKSNSFPNLKGILVTNPLIDASTQVDYYADYLYQSGLINFREYNYFRREQNKMKYHIKQRNWSQAFDVYDELIAGIFVNETYFQKVTGYASVNNLLDITYPPGFDLYLDYLSRDDVKEALHVPGIPFKSRNLNVFKEMIPDFFTSMNEELSDVFSRYRVLFIAGNLDILVPVASVSRAVNNVKWKCQDDLKNGDKEIGIWSVDDREVIGHLTTACDVYVVIVRNAGSNLIYDQQEVTYTLTQMLTNLSLPFEV